MDIQDIMEEYEDIIIERGTAYFRQGRVVDLEEIEPGEYEATVKGSEDYTVTITLEGDKCVDLSCECAYWGNPYCKHTVAVLLAIQAQQSKEKTSEVKSIPQGKGTKPMDPLSREALSALSSDALISLVRDIANEFPDVADWLRARLSSKEGDIKFYRQMIRKSIQACSRNGYISYRDMKDALRGPEMALAHLEGLINADASDAPAHILDFAFMLIEEVINLLGDGDDSNGGASGVFRSALRCIDDLYENRISHGDEPEQTTFFQQLMAKAQSTLFGPWNEEREALLDICTEIADCFPALRASIMTLWEQDIVVHSGKPDYSSRYALERAQKEYYELLSRWQGEENAWAFALSHLENDDLRLHVFTFYFERKRYLEALALCVDGERNAAAAHHPGVVEQWKKRRYGIYEQMNDRESMRALGEELLMDGDKAYYEKLVHLYPVDQWEEKRVMLLDSLEKGTVHHGAYLQIITQERDQPRILRYIEKSPHSIYSLYDHLLPQYEYEVRELFRKYLLSSAAKAQERKAYQGVCEGIEMYARACGPSPAVAILREIQEAYLRKPAFQEELGRIGDILYGNDPE